jgi:hypothetical protein
MNRAQDHHRLFVALPRLEQLVIAALTIVLLCLTAGSMALFISSSPSRASAPAAQFHRNEAPTTLIWRVTPERIVSLQSGATFPLRWENNAEWRGELATSPREILLLASPGASDISERLRSELHTAGVAARVRHVGTAPPSDSRRADPHHPIHWGR